MKRRAERTDLPPIRGYIAPCACCGLLVVHSHKHDEPFHMHRYSKLCRDRQQVITEKAAKAMAKTVTIAAPEEGGAEKGSTS